LLLAFGRPGLALSRNIMAIRNAAVIEQIEAAIAADR
jgi:hypothetical protein